MQHSSRFRGILDAIVPAPSQLRRRWEHRLKPDFGRQILKRTLYLAALSWLLAVSAGCSQIPFFEQEAEAPPPPQPVAEPEPEPTPVPVQPVVAPEPVAQPQPIAVRPSHPESYTVVEGDTLWDIAASFLEDPWVWPQIWDVNPQIANPHLIYPGDVISLVFVDGRPRLVVTRASCPGPLRNPRRNPFRPDEIPPRLPWIEGRIGGYRTKRDRSEATETRAAPCARQTLPPPFSPSHGPADPVAAWIPPTGAPRSPCRLPESAPRGSAKAR